MNDHIINLDNYRTPSSRIFATRPRGETCRKKAKLDELDQQEVAVTVKIPNDTFSINSSFFLGMFGLSIRHLGEEGFKQKYKFEAPSWIRPDIEDGISEALKEFSPL